MAFFWLVSCFILLGVFSGHGEPASLPELNIRPRIVNGQEAHPAAWPWHVVLMNETGYFICGGSLISSNLVITAAHCNVTTSSWAAVGMQTIHSPDDVQILSISQIFRHTLYMENSVHNDIALLKLSPRAHFNSKVFPVFLPRADDQFLRSSWCKIIGFGSIDFNGTKYPNKPQEATVTIMSSNRCQYYWPYISRRSMLCAGERGVSFGLLDSGGSLVCWKDRVWTLAGIMSFRPESFPTNTPFVVTRVTTFLPWIEEILAHSDPC